jgi:hypothetical protein
MRITIVLALVASIGLHAQQPPLPISDGQVIRLWSGAAPGALGNDDSDIPALTVYLPRVMNGILGFSAGGHLAMTASTWFDAGNPRADDIIERSGSRPDIAVLGYPVISMVEPWTHAGSKTNLLGQNPDPALAQRLSGERAVTKDTPATFIFQTNEDSTVPAENSLRRWRLGRHCSPIGCGSAGSPRRSG